MSQDSNFVATDELALRKAFLPAPEDPAAWPAWREKLHVWAKKERERLGPGQYDAEAQSWASKAYSQAMIMLWDHELIDHDTGEWKVDALCDRAERDFGGYDVVVLWNNYPLTGLDPRHQIAYYDELPGGREAFRAAVRRFHARGVRVLVDHKPWVPEPTPGFDNVEDAFVDLVRECELDGIYLDCSAGPEERFRKAMESGAGRDKVFCSEAPARREPVFGHEIGSWLQFTEDTQAPGSYVNRWLDRGHLVYESRRYFYDPIRELQRAWFNGGGHVLWENVFGYWAAYSPRYQSWLRLTLAAQRRFADFFLKGEWQPHLDIGQHARLYTTAWTLEGETLYTLVNRRGITIQKRLLKVPAEPDMQYVDVISGELLPVYSESEGERILGGRILRDGVAGVLAVRDLDEDLARFLGEQRARFAAANWEAPTWPEEHRHTELPHLLKPVQPTPSVGAPPDGMIPITPFSGWLTTRYRMREPGYIAGAIDEKHVYDAFHLECPYTRKVAVAGVAIDAFPVTNEDYHRFLNATGYTPSDGRNFLKHWVNGAPPSGEERHPVVYVSLTDARRYANWAGKRLPREEEWQLAACGTRAEAWPWNGPFSAEHCNHATKGTAAVDAHPEGCTESGIWDLSGNVWEMTESERTDGHTRYQILKGGSWYYVDNSSWLFDAGAQPGDWGAKQILLCDAWDRCATIGFRCVIDLDG